MLKANLCSAVHIQEEPEQTFTSIPVATCSSSPPQEPPQLLESSTSCFNDNMPGPLKSPKLERRTAGKEGRVRRILIRLGFKGEAPGLRLSWAPLGKKEVDLCRKWQEAARLRSCLLRLYEVNTVSSTFRCPASAGPLGPRFHTAR